MQIFLVLLLVAVLIATVVALVRGIITFLQAASDEARGVESTGPSATQLKSNRMMQQRILFQGLAVLIVVVLLFASGGK